MCIYVCAYIFVGVVFAVVDIAVVVVFLAQ